jgi:hypothetical protein
MNYCSWEPRKKQNHKAKRDYRRRRKRKDEEIGALEVSNSSSTTERKTISLSVLTRFSTQEKKKHDGGSRGWASGTAAQGRYGAGFATAQPGVLTHADSRPA